jgi:Tfp pilus assembly protein PilO
MIRRRPWLLFVAGAALATLYLLWTVALPRLFEARAHWRALQERDGITRQAARWQEDLYQIQVQHRRLQERYAHRHKDAPDARGRASTALDGLRSAADETGVLLRSVRPEAKTAAQAHAVRRITAHVVGTFPQVVQFVRAIETSSPFINVSQLSCRALRASAASDAGRGEAREGTEVAAEITGLAITPRRGWVRALREMGSRK